MSLLYRKKRPVVLVFAGHDPGGGAGIQADIETIVALGCHPVTIITAHTVQNTQGVFEVIGHDPAVIVRQCEVLLRDMSVAAVKIGLLGDAKTAQYVGELLKQYDLAPLVLDPVLVSGSGYALAEAGLTAAIRQYILPQVTVATPNRSEAFAFVEKIDASLGMQWLDMGCKGVLITGADDDTPQVHNVLTTVEGETVYEWPRLLGNFHGTGCTLVSAVAANLAQGLAIEMAVAQAQAYVHQTLQHAHCPGTGAPLPWRGGHEKL